MPKVGGMCGQGLYMSVTVCAQTMCRAPCWFQTQNGVPWWLQACHLLPSPSSVSAHCPPHPCLPTVPLICVCPPSPSSASACHPPHPCLPAISLIHICLLSPSSMSTHHPPRLCLRTVSLVPSHLPSPLICIHPPSPSSTATPGPRHLHFPCQHPPRCPCVWSL